MIAHICGGSPVEWPDAGEGMCCIGAAVYGPDRCTCWKPVYDRRQRKPSPAEPVVRTEPCVDCAYRGGSPERRGDPEYAGSDGELERLVVTGGRFFCHQGIRKPIRYRHPADVEVPGHPASYDPPIVDRVPYRANGMPAEICAGWARRREQFLKSQS